MRRAGSHCLNVSLPHWLDFTFCCIDARKPDSFCADGSRAVTKTFSTLVCPTIRALRGPHQVHSAKAAATLHRPAAALRFDLMIRALQGVVTS